MTATPSAPEIAHKIYGHQTHISISETCDSFLHTSYLLFVCIYIFFLTWNLHGYLNFKKLRQQQHSYNDNFPFPLRRYTCLVWQSSVVLKKDPHLFLSLFSMMTNNASIHLQNNILGRKGVSIRLHNGQKEMWRDIRPHYIHRKTKTETQQGIPADKLKYRHIRCELKTSRFEHLKTLP